MLNERNNYNHHQSLFLFKLLLCPVRLNTGQLSGDGDSLTRCSGACLENTSFLSLEFIQLAGPLATHCELGHLRIHSQT